MYSVIAAGFGIVVVLASLYWSTLLGHYFRVTREPPSATSAVEETAKRAQAKDPVAEYDLARRYLSGHGVRVNAQDAAIWLERAAEHGHARAQFELGMAALNGEGMLQDFPAALKWLSRAAEGGNAEARYNLGLLYKNGTGVAPDAFKSYIWLNLAASQGIEAAAGQRDATMRLLAPRQVVEAQAEARRLNRNTVERASKSGVEITGSK